ncbi:pre-terminal protein [Guinea pig adenovirus 1]|uniref:Pre-terminal protein n=1 Tax=Guinea pig adenovirus 1 TaxID=2847100 RepID=A0AC61LZX1_9ADEN|nr:pre-terminal protein [Guinea pig adenovirus]QIZ64152.1 pre-terminal protein [Guinea pig adenovirus 1]QIZ64184.1 pre-terminal protein [Guinea pig adenovirus]
MARYVYRYARLMLHDLSPRSPYTAFWPLYGFPPPHLLVGYQYVVRTCNDYVFDSRAYSRLRFYDTVHPGTQHVDWSVTATCTYTINTGTYHRFVDLDDFQRTLAEVQQAVLADRVVADLALIQPQRGFGISTFGGRGAPRGGGAGAADDGAAAPVERWFHEQYKSLSDCGEAAWGLSQRWRHRSAPDDDLVVLEATRRLRTAYFHFLLSENFTPPDVDRPEIAFPLCLPCDDRWLRTFVGYFCSLDTDDLLRRGREPVTETIKKAISALSLPDMPALPYVMRGGAFTLRPRERGRAVTETMRRRRGETVARFIESLPLRTRRRRVPPSTPADPLEGPSTRPMPGTRASPPASPSPPPSPEVAASPDPRDFASEVRAAVSEAIAQLREVLSPQTRQEGMFDFMVHFYSAMEELQRTDNVTEHTLRRWVIYFFIAEHMATTLNYLHFTLVRDRLFSRYVEVNLAQAIMRARDERGEVVYTRVWNEVGHDAFLRLMQRVGPDLAATVRRAGEEPPSEDEIDRFMQDIQFHEKSGDVAQILRQVAANDRDIDSVELSFRFRVSGPVAFSDNRNIRDINRDVIAYATHLRRQGRELPAAQQRVPYAEVTSAPPLLRAPALAFRHRCGGQARR